MLEITESGFNAPSLVIHFHEFSRREGNPVQIGNQVFPEAGRDFNRNHAEVQGIIELIFEVTEVKAGSLIENTIQIKVSFDLLGLLSGQDDMEIQIKSRIKREFQPSDYRCS